MFRTPPLAVSNTLVPRKPFNLPLDAGAILTKHHVPTTIPRRDAALYIGLFAQLAIQQGRTVALPQPFADIASSTTGASLA